MHPLITATLILTTLVACNHGTDSSTEHGETEHGHDSTGTPTTTGHTGETGHEHTTEHEHDTGTTHEHATEPGTDTTDDTGTTGEPATPAEAYCECMLVYCHDEYHGTWGEDHETSVAMCQAAAAALPGVGMPATQGNSIECRLHHCDLAKTDEAACASAIGGGMCV